MSLHSFQLTNLSKKLNCTYKVVLGCYQGCRELERVVQYPGTSSRDDGEDVSRIKTERYKISTVVNAGLISDSRISLPEKIHRIYKLTMMADKYDVKGAGPISRQQIHRRV